MQGEIYCDCGANHIQSLPDPLFRFVCHCTTCRTFSGAPHNDECTFLLNECSGLNLANTEFQSYQSGFSPIKRGKCKRCGKVTCCIAHVWPYPEFLMLPSCLVKGRPLPDPLAHIYYDSRVADAPDSFKRINGHFRGQLAIQTAIVGSLFKRMRRA